MVPVISPFNELSIFCHAIFFLSILESYITLGVHLKSRVHLTNILFHVD